MRRWLYSIAAATLVSLSSQAHAQQDGQVADNSANRQSEIETYSPADFSQFQPNTALDMVEQIPGFTLRSGDNERGFGEADVNFLVNGRRPSTKNQDAEDILSRIPANTVIRIEILDGNSLDIPGLTGQVANIVARSVDLSGRWRYAARFEEGTEPQLLEGEITLTGERGDIDFSIGLESGQFTRSEDSVEVFLDGNRALIEDRTEETFLRNIQPSANLNLTWTPSNGVLSGHVANLNASIDFGNDNSGIRETFVAIDPSRTSGESFANIGENELEFEIGADYSFPLKISGADGNLKLIGLFRSEDEDGETVFVNAFNGQTPTRTLFREDNLEGERIARAEYHFKAGKAHDIQTSVEYAFNFLDSTTQFENNFVGPLFDDVRVEEDRFNARVTDSWQINSDLSLQTSVGAEYSTLQVVEPLSDARNFFRPKGFAALSYQISDRYAIRPRVERSVGQLNFGTFVSTRNLTENLITSGNGEIKPSQSWELSIEFERIDDRLISGTIKPYYERIEDPIDRILFQDGTEGPGNLDNAVRYGVDINSTLLFDTLGVPGLRLESHLRLGDSRIDDPLTGERRQINSNLEYVYRLVTRYDIPNTDFTLTGSLYNEQNSPFYRLDNIQEVTINKPFLTLGFIHKDFFGMQLSVTGTNLLDNIISQEQLRYQTNDLRLGPLTRIERFGRQRGRRLSITLSDTF